MAKPDVWEGGGAGSVINLRHLTFGATMGMARPSRCRCRWRQAEAETEAEMPRHVETFANARRAEGIILPALMQLAKLRLESAVGVSHVCVWLWP